MTSAVAIKERGETAFQEAGDGVVLCFRNSDLKQLETELGEKFFSDIFENQMTMSFAAMELYLEKGVKKKGEPYVIPEKVIDKIPVMDVMEKIVDALCLSMRGKSMKDYIKELTDSFAAAVERGDPPNP